MNTSSSPAPSALFTEKVWLFSQDYLKCCLYIGGLTTNGQIYTKKLFAELISTSRLLEDFLDVHGAKNSREWFFYRELSAAIRHLSLAGYDQEHITNRLPFYELSDVEVFKQDGQATQKFLIQTLSHIAPVVIDEAQKLGIPLPNNRFDVTAFPRMTTGELLPNTVDTSDDLQCEGEERQKEIIVKIASDLIGIADHFEQIAFFETYSHEALLTLVPQKINEVEIRRFEMLVHNLQSSFDTYVVHGGFRPASRKLNRLRGHFSVVFHLLKYMGRLLHFYERHLRYDHGYKNIYRQVQDRLAEMVNIQTLLDRTINYGLYYVCHFMASGKKLSQEILNENIARATIRVGIPVQLGFHARPSLLVAKIVQHYGGQVEMVAGDSRFDASSVLDIQWAGGKINKENISEVVFEGDTRALRDLEILASVNYGEDTMGKGIPLPEPLQYLR